MATALSAQSAIENFAAITKRTIQLSHSLYDISSGLAQSPVTPAINTIAEEFTELSNLAQQLGSLVKKSENVYTEQLVEDAGKALSRLDMLVKYFEDTITEFSTRRVPRRFRDLFKESNISDLTWYCRSVKEPLRMQISHLRIAHEQQRLKRSKKKKQHQDVTALTRECEFAESWVEASRQVIKALISAERRAPKGPTDDSYQFHNRVQSWGSTAVWLYNFVFARALKARPAGERLKSRGSRVKTVHTSDGNTAASDSEQSDEITDHIPPELELELYYTTGLRRDVVHELLQRWTGLDYRPLRQITDSTRRRESTRIQESVAHIIQWYGSEDEGKSALQNKGDRTRGRERDSARSRSNSSHGRSTLVAKGALPPARTPPTSPRTNASQKQSVNKTDGVNEDAVEGSYSTPVRGRSTVPVVSFAGRSMSAGTVELRPKDISTFSLYEGKKKDSHTILKRGGTITTQGDAPLTITFSDPPQTASKKPAVSKSRANDGNIGMHQNGKRASSQHTSSRPESSTHHFQKRRKEDYYSSDGFASSSKPQPRPYSLRQEEIRHRDSMTSRLLGDDSRTSNGYSQHVPPIPHRSFADSQMRQAPSTRTPNPFSISGTGGSYVPPPDYTFHAQYPSVPTQGGPHLSPAAPVRPGQNASMHPAQEAPSEDGRFVLIQNQLDAIAKGEKARKDAEKANIEENRQRAQEEEERRAAYSREIKELQTRLLEAQEDMRRKTQKWEEEKRTIEINLKEKTLTEEQALRRAEEEGQQAMSRKEEIDRLHEIIKNFEESGRQTTQEWDKEREKLIQVAEEKVRHKLWASEEERQTAIDGVVKDFEKKLEQEQENVRQAKQRAEHYVELYNATIISRHKNPHISSSGFQRPEDPYNAMNYLDTNRNSSSASVEVESSMESESSVSWVEKNPWRDKNPWQRAIPQDHTRRYTASATSDYSDEASNIIVFPPRAGASEFGPNQLGNYLSSSGFKAMFEVRETSAQDSRGQREKIGSGGNVLRGTLFWQPPASTAEAELYKSLRSSGWRPTYVRTTASGQTWFFGPQPVHAQFFSDMYKPQVAPVDISRASRGAEKESLIISKDLVEIDELDFLGHIYKELDGRIFLDPTLTAEDIDHIVARSFLAREGMYRKKFRNTHLRFVPPTQDIFEVASEAGESESSQSSASTRGKMLSLWPSWGPWSGSR